MSESLGFQPAGRAPAPAPLDLVQDFVNTEIAEWARDDISTPDALARWLRARRLVGADEAVDADTFVHARALRGVLRGLALANTLGEVPDAQLRDEFRNAVERVRFVPRLGTDGRVGVEAEAGGSYALAALLSCVLEAQADGTWQRLKACRKDSCQWLFYDASRNASSTWCSMSICGNRTKTAAYRRRRKAPT